jgi:hypothetical protein
MGELAPQPVAVGPPVGDLGDQASPLAGQAGVGGEPVQLGEGEVQFHHPTTDPTWRSRPGWTGASGSAAQWPGEQEVAVAVDEGELPFGAAGVTGGGGAGDGDVDGAEAGDLAGAFVAAQQGGQANPQLDSFADSDPLTGPAVLSRAGRPRTIRALTVRPLAI